MKQSVQWVIVTALLGYLAVDFHQRIYVTYSSESREWQATPLSLLFTRHDYDQNVLEETLKSMYGAADTTGPAQDPSAELPGEFSFGDIKLVLLAIYQQRQPTAVVSLKQSDGSRKIHKVISGGKLGNVDVIAVGTHHLELSYQGQTRKLKLFSPDNRSKE